MCSVVLVMKPTDGEPLQFQYGFIFMHFIQRMHIKHTNQIQCSINMIMSPESFIMFTVILIL